jgi:hypothetical protein
MTGKGRADGGCRIGFTSRDLQFYDCFQFLCHSFFSLVVLAGWAADALRQAPQHPPTFYSALRPIGQER